MHKLVKYGLGVAGIGGTALGVGYLFFLNNLRNVVVNIEPKIESISFEKIILNVRFIVKNPSPRRITLTQPFIDINYNGFSLFSSKLMETKITVNANSQSAPIAVPVEIKILNTLTPLAFLSNALLQKKPFSFDIDTRVTFTGMWPYRKTVKNKINLPVII